MPSSWVLEVAGLQARTHERASDCHAGACLRATGVTGTAPRARARSYNGVPLWCGGDAAGREVAGLFTRRLTRPSDCHVGACLRAIGHYRDSSSRSGALLQRRAVMCRGMPSSWVLEVAGLQARTHERPSNCHVGACLRATGVTGTAPRARARSYNGVPPIRLWRSPLRLPNPDSPIPASRRLAARLCTRVGDQGLEQGAVGVTGDRNGTERDRFGA